MDSESAKLGSTVLCGRSAHTAWDELKGVKQVSVILDGTARLGEALAIIIRYVQDNFKPTQCLIRLEILVKAMKGEELA